MLLNGSQQAAQQRYVHSPTSSDDAMKPKGRNCVARRCGVMVYRQARASKMSANIPCPPIFQRGIKKLSAAPFNQGATGPKPKRRQIVIKLFLSNNVEIISYLHYTIVLPGKTSSRRIFWTKLPFFLSPKIVNLMRKIFISPRIATIVVLLFVGKVTKFYLLFENKLNLLTLFNYQLWTFSQ